MSKFFTTAHMLAHVYGIKSLTLTQRGFLAFIVSRMQWTTGYGPCPKGEARISNAEMVSELEMSRQGIAKIIASLTGHPVGLTVIRTTERDGRYSVNRYTLESFNVLFDDDYQLKAPNDLKRRQPQELAVAGRNTTLTTTTVAEHEVNRNTTKMKSGDFLKIDLDTTSGIFTDPRISDLVKTARTGCRAENADLQLIWKDFRNWNLKRGNHAPTVQMLVGFVRKWEPRRAAKVQPVTRDRVRNPQPGLTPRKAVAATASECRDLQGYAPFKNHNFHEMDLCRRIGETSYRDRLNEMRNRTGTNLFSARWAVHGAAIRSGEISP